MKKLLLTIMAVIMLMGCEIIKPTPKIGEYWCKISCDPFETETYAQCGSRKKVLDIKDGYIQYEFYDNGFPLVNSISMSIFTDVNSKCKDMLNAKTKTCKKQVELLDGKMQLFLLK